jgi:hypothetical protein
MGCWKKMGNGFGCGYQTPSDGMEHCVPSGFRFSSVHKELYLLELETCLSRYLLNVRQD